MKKLIVITCMLIANFYSEANIWYVNATATGTASGTSWANAFIDVASAISASNNGDSIWVATGTYKPSATLNTVFYNLKSGVSLYGGFNATETLFTQRNVTANLTTLSGDIGVLGYPNDNSLNIFKATNLALLATVDGFTIKDAYRSSGYGAGALVSNSEVLFENCRFLSNNAQCGAAIYFSTINAGTPEKLTIINCEFDNNVTFNSGGAIFVYGGNVVLKKSKFSSNISTSYGGAVLLQSFNSNYQTYTIDKCFFTNNSADEGAAIYGSSLDATSNVTNCLFAGNFTQRNNMVRLTESFNASTNIHNINNCTFANNTFDTTTASNSIRKLLDLESGTSKVSNCIIWKNKSNKILDSTSTVNNNIIQNGFAWGTNNINVNPNFMVPNANNTSPFVANLSDFKLLPNSPAINFGDNTLNITTLDLLDSARVQNTNIDLGCFEKTYCTFPVNINTTANSSFCAGDTAYLTASAGNVLLWNNNSNATNFAVNASGIYTLTALDTISGCRGDAVSAINFLAPNVQTINTLVCSGQNYTLPNGSLLTNITTAANYSNTFTASNGCDSILNIAIGIKQNSIKNVSKNVCSGNNFTFPDGFIINNITTTVNHTSVLVNAVGCDSIINTTVTPVIVFATTNNITVCKKTNYTFPDGFVVNNILTGLSHTSNLTTSIGCDSVIITNLTITTVDTSVSFLNPFQIKANQGGATYKWYNCDTKQIVIGAISQTFMPNTPGNYAAIISINGCKDTSNCYFLMPMSISNIALGDAKKLFPNPNDGLFNIVIEAKSEIEITNINGALVYKKELDAGTQKINCAGLKSGIYTLKIISKNSAEIFKLQIQR